MEDNEYLSSLNEIELFNHIAFEVCEHDTEVYDEYFEDESKKYEEEVNTIIEELKERLDMEEARQQYRDSVVDGDVLEAL